MVSGGCLILGGRDWNSGRWLLYLFGGCYRMSLDWSYEGGFKGNHGFDFDHHFIGLPENIPFNHCQEQRDATSVDEPTICWMGLYKWLGKSLANVWLVVEVGGVDPPRMRFLPLANPKKNKPPAKHSLKCCLFRNHRFGPVTDWHKIYHPVLIGRKML